MSRRKRKKNPKTLERRKRNARKAAKRLAAQFNQPDGRNCVARVSDTAVARPMGVSAALAGTLGTGALEVFPGPHSIPDEEIRRATEADIAARERHMRELRSDIERDRWENRRAREVAKRLRRAGAAPPPPAPRHGQSRFAAVVLAMAALGGCPLDCEPPPPPPPLKRPPWGKEPP